MLPTSSGALAVILLAIVPGFIAATTWARARTWKGPSGDLRTVLQSLALSAAIQVLISPLTIAWIVPIRTHLADHPGRVAIWFLLVVLVIPLVLGVLGARLTDLIFRPVQLGRPLGRLTRGVTAFVKAPAPPSVWDWLFTAQPPNGGFVIIQFNDGSQVGGVFAEHSVALTSPEPQGLFLESEWLLNEEGDFTGPMPGTEGIMIPTIGDVRWVRILRGADMDQGEG